MIVASGQPLGPCWCRCSGSGRQRCSLSLQRPSMQTHILKVGFQTRPPVHCRIVAGGYTHCCLLSSQWSPVRHTHLPAASLQWRPPVQRGRYPRIARHFCFASSHTCPSGQTLTFSPPSAGRLAARVRPGGRISPTAASMQNAAIVRMVEHPLSRIRSLGAVLQFRLTRIKT